ncbi:hypothetical protein N9893_02965 [bacterium]|nr:hypothetical protein [bacterium]
MKKPDQYAVMSLMSHRDNVDRQFKEKQDQGWELAGDIVLKNKSGWCGDTIFHIPLKRKLETTLSPYDAKNEITD